MLRTELVGRHARLREERVVYDERAVAQVGFNVFLQTFGELLLAFRRDNGQQVHIQEISVAEQVAVLTNAFTVHA